MSEINPAQKPTHKAFTVFFISTERNEFIKTDKNKYERDNPASIHLRNFNQLFCKGFFGITSRIVHV
jgi:hypothetical protein